MPPKKITTLMLLEDFPFPQDRRVRMEAMSLTNAGYQVIVISPKEDQQRWSDSFENILIYRYPLVSFSGKFLNYFVEYGYSTIAMFLLSIYILFRHGFNVIHMHNPPDVLILIGAIYRLIGKKVIFDHHDLSPELFNAKFDKRFKNVFINLLIFFEKLSCKLSNRIIATNESYKKIEMQRHKIPESKITIVRNAPSITDNETIDPIPEISEKDSIIIGYGGIIGHQDRVDNLIEALYILENQLNKKDFFCLIVGIGDALEEVKQLVHDRGLESKVLFTGWQDNINYHRYLASTDICVVPDPYNQYNDFSTMIKLMDYMIVGKPIVAYELTEHRATAGEGAIYVTSNETLEMAQKIAWLIDNPQQRARIGQIGLERAKNILAWKHQEKKLIQLYTDLIAGEK